ncbi:MAG: AAA family ATPase [Bacteroidales bacterium]|nr:AAA family ATPase [Bacteroidales bacterium]
MERYNDLNALARGLREKLDNKKIILLYAYNGVGKTRLSMEFKDIGKRDGGADTLYFNAFTEDLFSWDNDLARDTTRTLKMNLRSRFFEGAKDYALEDKIKVFFRCFSDIDFQIDYEQGRISFSRTLIATESGRPTRQSVDNIKISRGEEAIFIWCFFLAVVQLVLDDDEAYAWVKYVYIDDPISSLDDNNAVAVAVQLAEMLREASIKVVISTHHVLFYNALYNIFKRAFRYHLIKVDQEHYELKAAEGDTPQLLHIAILAELWKRAEQGELYTYHFAMLRNVLERSASFHGYRRIEDCFTCEDSTHNTALYDRMINILTHGNYAVYEPIEMLDDNKKLFKQILSAFLKNYKFNPKLFDSVEV